MIEVDFLFGERNHILDFLPADDIPQEILVVLRLIHRWGLKEDAHVSAASGIGIVVTSDNKGPVF